MVVALLPTVCIDPELFVQVLKVPRHKIWLAVPGQPRTDGCRAIFELRFLEFAYRGDYTVPSPDIVITPKDVGELSQPCQANPLPTWLAVGPWMLVLLPHKLSTVGQATLFWI